MVILVIVASCAAVMVVVELALQGRRWPQVNGWWARAALLNGIQIASVFVAGMAWDRWFVGRGLWDLSTVPVSGQVIVGYLAITFIYYWWHRLRHESPLLWCWFHQIHHSPQRIEIITSFYKHPIEIFGNSVLSSAILYLLCGASPEAGSLTVMITGLAELFYHWNVRTPYWLGFIFQRPESHCVHHQLNLHRYNYADLPLWDIIFGTFHNPRRWGASCGFAENREVRLGSMLIGRDVNATQQAP